ncbi:arylsulfatase B isoform X2 [Cherax quadricarinatus]|uniref:arylsulfatase B isoform X2 n=1 Tax=Cherax quadricarinatus TaxID=27406 RepID=UPI00387EAD93
MAWSMHLRRIVWVVVMVITYTAATPLTPSSSSTPPPPTSPGTPPPVPPHIIFMVADDLGWNDVSWHNPQVLMPHLESLARDGIILEQSYVQPICTPTRSALLSGRYPFTIGRQNSILQHAEPVGLDLQLKLLPQALKDVGYQTHAVGKWHLGFCSWDYTPTMRGFDTFYGYYTGSEDYNTHHRSHVFESCNTSNVDHCSDLDDAPGGKKEWLDLRNNKTPDRSQDGVYSTYMFASYIEDLLRTRNPEDPMFLYVPFQSVHAPLMVPEKYTEPFVHIKNSYRRTYLGMVSAMDEAVGRVVEALKITGHYDNSVIIFTTDNGGQTIHGANNWPLRGRKGTLWEGGTRGVAFIHSPILPNPGTISHQLVHVTDWYKTLVGLAKGEAPEDIDGVDQWSSFVDSAPPPRTHMIYNIDNTTQFKAAVRIGKYKLLVGFPGKGEWTPPPELRLNTVDAPLGQPNESPPSRHPGQGPVLPQVLLPTETEDPKDGQLEKDYDVLSSSDSVRRKGVKSSLEDRALNYHQANSSSKIRKSSHRHLISTKRTDAGPFVFISTVPKSRASSSLSVDIDADIDAADILSLQDNKGKHIESAQSNGRDTKDAREGEGVVKRKTISDNVWTQELDVAIQELLLQITKKNDAKIRLYNVEGGGR